MEIQNKLLKQTSVYAVFIILIVFLISFLDLKAAVFVGCVCLSILAIRNLTGTLNPGHINGYKIFKNGEELFVPKTVEVFEFTDVASASRIRRYVDLIRSMVVPPRIIIIRFQKSFEITQASISVIITIAKLLSEAKIDIILCEANENVQAQIKKADLFKSIDECNIFNNIEEALMHAKKLL